jgi:hypothetical protein
MRTLWASAVVALSVVTLAACGGNSDDGGGDNASSSNDRDTARLKLQECLRKQGLEAPGRGGGNGPLQASAAERRKLQDAIQGPCKEHAQGAFGEISEEQRQEFQDAFAKFSACMRKNGIDLPDITPGEGPPAGGGGVNRNSAKFRKASEECRELLPNGGAGGDRIIGQAPPS